MSSTASFNISFMYHMFGLGMGGLHLKAKNGTGSWEDIWSVTGDRGDQWLPVTLTVPPGFETLRFDAIAGADWRSDIAIDAVTIHTSTTTSTTTTTPASTTPPASTGIEACVCGFGNGLCNWTSSGSHQWVGHSGSTASGGTGPSGAHQGNYYVYVESSSPNYPDKIFIMESPTFSAGPWPRALYFAYSMKGSAMGTLTLEYTDGAGSWTTIWQKSGDQGDGWFTDGAEVPGIAVQLRFKAVTGSGFRSDFALDTITASESAPTPPPPMQASAAGTCHFEHDFCNWLNVGEKDWTRDSAGTPSSNTGPSGAKEGHYYIYTEASGSNKNKVFSLETPRFVVNPTMTTLVNFWYHMKGTSMGSLTLSYMDSADTWHSLFSVTGSQGDDWLPGQAVLPLDAVALQLKGHTGNGWSSDMAVDDIKVVEM